MIKFNGRVLVVSTALLAVTLMAVVRQVDSECCYVPFHCTEPGNVKVSRCYDCTKSTPYCGIGSCNVFGCNCDNGCRHGNESLWCWNPAFNCGKPETTTPHSLLQSAPSTPELASSHRLAQARSHVRALFAKADQNGDGVLSALEFAAFGHKYAPDQIAVLGAQFAATDSNGDGVLTIQEIATHEFAH